MFKFSNCLSIYLSKKMMTFSCILTFLFSQWVLCKFLYEQVLIYSILFNKDFTVFPTLHFLIQVSLYDFGLCLILSWISVFWTFKSVSTFLYLLFIFKTLNFILVFFHGSIWTCSLYVLCHLYQLTFLLWLVPVVL